jgi:glycosyltransferase involved in cell wall biosynthesis
MEPNISGPHASGDVTSDDPEDCAQAAKKRRAEDDASPLVSIIMPVYNAADFLVDALDSIAAQTYRPLELVVFDDCSTDLSPKILQDYAPILEGRGVSVVIRRSSRDKASGPGYGRNQAVEASSGEYLCHLDADDLMAPRRVELQLARARAKGDSCLVGSNFNRIPEGSTSYYTDWLNSLSDEQILAQRYRECTIICPTWFMHRRVFDRVAAKRSLAGSAGAYVEERADLDRVPEDTFFFMDHLAGGGSLSKVPEQLVTYRYTAGSWCHGTSRHDLQKARMPYIEREIIMHPEWSSFTVWGYGKDGRKFVTRLSAEAASRVSAFCDVDPNKVGMTYFIQSCRKHVPIIHFTDAKPPIIVCVGSKRTEGALEENIKLLNMTEGKDYYHFS